MKKIFGFIFAMLAFANVAFAQQVYDQNNYAGSSKLTDNISVKAQIGAATSFDNMFKHGDIHRVIVLGVEKYLNPWLGVEVEGRTLVSSGYNYNAKTAFDMVNVSGYTKFNLANMYSFTGDRHTFEPVVYTGLGWGHATFSNPYNRNWMTYRAGAELTYNIGNSKAFGIVVNPSVVWGNIDDNVKLNKHNGVFEITAGVVYHFKTSNGKRSYAKARLYDPAEIAALNARIDELRRLIDNEPSVIEKVVEKQVPMLLDRTFIVMFEKSKADLTDDAKETLKNVTGTVKVVATASPEGTSEFNQKISELRAQVVTDFLKNNGVNVVETTGVGVTGVTSNRVAIVTVVE